MKRIFLLTLLINTLIIATGYSQSTQSNITNGELKGRVLDIDKKIPLPYANIYVLHKHKGTISNEKGDFSIDISGLEKSDTLRFQYIGYKTRNLLIGQLDTLPVVYLKEEIINLNEAVVFGTAPDPEEIVKNVIRYKDSNYRRTTCIAETFIRERYTNDIDEINFDYKKSSFDDLNRETVAMAEEKIPKHTTSYTDFLGNIYLPGNKDDTIKIDPIRTVALKEKNVAEMKQLEEIFRNALAETGENEYWKIKSGIFGQKIDLSDEDTIPEKDTLNDNEQKLKYFSKRTGYNLKYSWLENKNDWEFLYNTGRYKYILTGGARVNGEDVYIIDFEPDGRGRYTGRLYISVNTFALIRADYEYAMGKTGTNIHLLGVGYTENEYNGSIYFEKKNDNYVLKYFSRKVGSIASFDRNLALLKKRKRFLFDKKLKEIKVGVKITVTSESLVEVLVLDEKNITREQFAGFKQKEYMEIIYVDQFNDKLWKGYPIIEPTKRMREYKKQVETE
ncbi:MAG: carboxypeptidase-like regulatory domain-containing protein [Chlorobi bacterium]|nr:carboxypeptidase-like regulatory domain-containing protein [Chlorobiota bacterium]